MPLTKSSGNIFKDLELPDAEALTYKTDLIRVLQGEIDRRGLTQTKAAAICGTDQPTLSKVLRGNLELVSTDRLFKWLVLLGLMVRITIDTAPQGGIRVCACR